MLDAVKARLASHSRCLVALAGPPGAGKSTLAATLVRSFPAGTAKILPMDGFHYDNPVLDELGLRARKGAPETFDFAGFAVTLQRIRQGEPAVAVPLFDREADLARAAASIIHSDVKVIVVEGNYLLLDREPWNGLAKYFDLTAFLDVPRDELKQRLMDRWLNLGYTPSKAQHWVDTNDMPNVDLVLSSRLAADFS